MLLVVVLALIITIPALFGNSAGLPVAFFAVTSITTIGLYIAYILPVFLRWRMGDRLQPGVWTLGKHYRWINAIAIDVYKRQLQICTWSELRGVLAHEISHVRNRDILTASVAASIAMGITFLARVLAWSGLFFGGLGGGRGRSADDNILGLLAMVILAPLAATLLQLALSRSREYEADRDGARLIGDGEPLASALSKLDYSSQRVPMQVPREMAGLFIVNPLAGRRVAFGNWFSDHPPTDKRIARLRSQEWAHRL